MYIQIVQKRFPIQVVKMLNAKTRTQLELQLGFIEVKYYTTFLTDLG